MSDPLIDVEIEDEAWAAAGDVEGLVRQAAKATFERLVAMQASASSPVILRSGEARSGGPMVGAETPDRPSGDAPESPAWPLEWVLRIAARPKDDSSERDRLSVTVLLTDDAAVADLNSRFRGKDGPTNVLSFPAPGNPEGHLGDIALAFGVCAREAAEQGKTLEAHLQHLVAHGVLHLVGYDHQTDDEAEAMEDLERAILAGLGHPDPYR